MTEVSFLLNGAPVSTRGPAARRLLDILRDDHGLTGAKPGCEIGRCGACLVWLDDQPVNACLVMAWQLAGRRVRTIESVAADSASAPVREALAACGAVQCGYCSAGQVMALTWLHQHRPGCGPAEASALGAGNLCRCGTAPGIARAIDRLFGTPGSEPPPAP